MTAYLLLFGFLGIIIGFTIYKVVLSIKKPTQIVRGDYNSDEISIRVWSSVSRFYDYTFVKRKNGKYRMKPRILCFFGMAASIFQLAYGLFALYCFKGEFISHPDVMPALISVVIWMIYSFLLAVYSLIEPGICFRRVMKEMD